MCVVYIEALTNQSVHPFQTLLCVICVRLLFLKGTLHIPINIQSLTNFRAHLHDVCADSICFESLSFYQTVFVDDVYAVLTFSCGCATLDATFFLCWGQSILTVKRDFSVDSACGFLFCACVCLCAYVLVSVSVLV